MIRRKYATDGAVQPMTFMEDAKGNKYDVAGNIIPPADEAINNALTTARAETYNPYAEEIASAKRLMADQAYQNQSWGDWASDVGQNLYNTGMAFLPTALGGQGAVGLSDIAKGIYESGKSAATLPGDVLTSKTKVFDPTSGGLTDEVLRRGSDFTGFMTLGAGAIPAEANTLRMGMKGVPPSPEDAALKAAQEATGGDDVAAATRAAQLEALNPVPPPQGIASPSPEHALGTQRGARTVISPTSIKLTPAEQAIVNKFKSRADRALVASRIRETKARYPKSDGWSPFEAVGASIDDKGNPVIEWKKQNYGFNTAKKPGTKTQVDPVTGEEFDVSVIKDSSLRPGTKEYEKAAAKATKNGVDAVQDIVLRAAEGDEAALKIIRQAGWYREFMRKGFDERGGSYPAFSDLLGATSPNTAVDQNYRYSVDLQNRFARGDFDAPVKFASEYEGDLNKFPEEKLIYRNPVGPKGPQKLQYGMNSRNAQMALADRWRKREPNQAPKARNFSGNLGGATDEATIDVWAARFVNRMAGRKRLPPPVESGVKGKLGANLVPTGEFGYGQDVFRRMTDELNRRGNLLPYLKSLGYDSLTPMDMQALTWFIEKEHWTKNNWTTAAGEGGSFEDELLKYPSERWQSGVSIEQNAPPTDAEMAYTRNVFENSLRDDPNVNQYRVHPTIGRYDGYNERAFDLELTAKPGWNPRTWMAAVIREAQANNQKDVFFSKRLSPEAAQTNPNARPGVEIYFRDRKTLDQAMPILEEFTKRNSDGFTFVTDLRLRERELGGKQAPDFVGVRLQWVPEIRSRFDEDFRNAVAADPSVLDTEKVAALNSMQNALDALDRAGLGIVDARVHNYDTLTVGKESYDKFLEGIENPDNASGRYEGGAGAAVDPVKRFGQPLYSHVEGRNRALRTSPEGGQPDTGGDVVGAGQPAGALTPQQRAIEQGFTTEAYRGSNRDIQEYGPRASESGYYGGKPTYFTSSPEDATGYTRVPTEEYEVSPYDQLKILQETNPTATLEDVLSGKYPNLADEYVNRLAGGENLGAVYPSKLRMQNPVKVGGEGETIFRGSQAEDLIKNTATTLAEAGISEQAAVAILGKLDDMLQSGGFGAMDFDLAVRDAARSVDKRLAAKMGSILADVYQRSGFDGIDLDASVFSDRRAGSYSYKAPAGSRHYMVFDPENIRGRFAKFGGIGPEGPAYMKAMGGAVDEEDIDNALRIARAMGGRTGYAEAGSVPVLMEDAKGNKYDAKGNIIPPQNPGPNPSRVSGPTLERAGMMDIGEPENYETEVKPFIEAATTPMNYALEIPAGYSGLPVSTGTVQTAEPTLLETMKIATQLAASGQPSDERGAANWSLGRQEAVRRLVGAPEGGATSAYRGPFGYNPSDTANYLNTLIDFSPYAFVEMSHDLPYEGARTGDYGTAATEGALNVALTAPVIAAIGAMGRAGYNALRRNPKVAAGLAGVGAYFMPEDAEAGPERWFSKLVRAAEALPMEKMTGEQALAMLRKSAPQEEIKWTGLEGFASDNPVTTKKALLDFIKRNQVQTHDVVLGGSKPTRRDAVVPSEAAIAPYKERWDELVAQNRAINEVMLLPPSQRDADIDDLLAQRNDIQYEMDQIHDKAVDATIEEMGGLGKPVRYGPGTRYEQYNTLGGEDYRETLVTVPSLGQRNVFEVRGAFPRQFETREKAEKYISDLNAMLENPEFEALHDNLRRYPSSIYEVPLENQGYRSQHWDEPNIIGHIRTQMLTANPPGANRPLKLFNVDENQSDMAQAGRKQGFVTIEDRMNYPNMSKQYDAMNAQRRKLETLVRYGDDANPEVQAASGQLAELDRQMQALSDKMASIRGGGVPAAPYVTSTQGWTDLSIKKALDQAIDSGADYFTFTPGEVQAARYDLSKHIGKVQYNPDDGSLLAYDPKGRMVINESVSDPSDLDEFVGAELAGKLRAEEENRRYLSEDAYGVDKDPDTGEWYVHIYGEPTEEAFSSKRDAQYYINEMIANDFSSSPVELSGLDLRTGGEGMIDYYNNIYKKRVEKVVKDLTGKKVQWEVLPAETAEGIVPRLGFRIDDDLREAKFPTFASGGIVNKALELTRDY